MSQKTPATTLDFRNESVRRRGTAALAQLVDAIEQNTYRMETVSLVRFILALHDPTEYRFDLSELRDLDPKMVDACLAYLALDALHEEGVHFHIPGGEATIDRWMQDYGPPLTVRPEIEPDRPWTARLVSTDTDYGYRGITAVFDVIDEAGADRRITLAIDADSAGQLREDIVKANRAAWRDEGPRDRKPGEKAPRWVLD